jgi:hypothetical protein
MLYRKGLLIFLKSICRYAGLALKPVPHLQHVTEILWGLSNHNNLVGISKKQNAHKGRHSTLQAFQK